jgi:hypothetical protein
MQKRPYDTGNATGTSYSMNCTARFRCALQAVSKVPRSPEP